MSVDTETLREALRVTVLGMGLVFASLGILMLVMGGLERVFRPAAKGAAAPPAQALTEERKRVAAMAVALMRGRRRAGAALRARRRAEADAWTAWGRVRQMETRRGGGEQHR